MSGGDYPTESERQATWEARRRQEEQDAREKREDIEFIFKTARGKATISNPGESYTVKACEIILRAILASMKTHRRKMVRRYLEEM